VDRGVEVGDEEVCGIGAVEAVVDADEDPTPLLGDDDVDAVLARLPLRPLQAVGLAGAGRDSGARGGVGRAGAEVGGGLEPVGAGEQRAGEVPDAAAAVGEAPAEGGDPGDDAAGGGRAGERAREERGVERAREEAALDWAGEEPAGAGGDGS
jgi:hypothetical protein